jgi:predicted XRE-type DNA-binding protein
VIKRLATKRTEASLNEVVQPKTSINQVLVTAIRQSAKTRGLSIKQVADASGVQRTTVREIFCLAEPRPWSIDKLAAVAVAAGVDVFVTIDGVPFVPCRQQEEVEE